MISCIFIWKDDPL